MLAELAEVEYRRVHNLAVGKVTHGSIATACKITRRGAAYLAAARRDLLQCKEYGGPTGSPARTPDRPPATSLFPCGANCTGDGRRRFSSYSARNRTSATRRSLASCFGACVDVRGTKRLVSATQNFIRGMTKPVGTTAIMTINGMSHRVAAARGRIVVDIAAAPFISVPTKSPDRPRGTPRDRLARRNLLSQPLAEAAEE
jgi:hypothetical protein